MARCLTHTRSLLSCPRYFLAAACASQTLKRFAYDHCVDKFTRFSTEVLTVRHRPDGL